MTTSSNLRSGDWVEVRSKDEILKTLDERGQLDGMPFMPQMFQYCGRRFRVYKRAHKTCDTVNQTGGRRVANAIHFELRCDGQAYGGCQAGCLLFWKDAWLKPVEGDAAVPAVAKWTGDLSHSTAQNKGCSEQQVWAGTRAQTIGEEQEPAYVCQATQIPQATVLLRWWDLRQYIEDLTSRNIGVGKLLRGLLYANYFNFSRLGIGVGPFMRWFYDRFQALWGGLPYPRKQGTIPVGQKTPHEVLNLQPGELVRIKSYEQILATLDTDNKNRGLYFDAEAVPYCGGTYRVARRIGKILDERTGKLVKMKTESIVLEKVFCQARYSDCRMFCPRSIDSYWREIWLERVTEAPLGTQAEPAKPATLPSVRG